MSATLAAVMVLAMADTPRFGALDDQQHVLTRKPVPVVVMPLKPAVQIVELVDPIPLPLEEVASIEQVVPEAIQSVVPAVEAKPAKAKRHKKRKAKLTNTCNEGKQK